MTSAQQAALEALIGRALHLGEATAIDTLLPGRNDVAIAAILSVDRIQIVPHEIGERGVLDVLGPVAGDAFLSALEAITSAEALPAPLQPFFGAIRRGTAWLKSDGIDVGATATRQLLDGLAAHGLLDPTSADAIKALAEQPDPIPVGSVSDALNVAEGRMTL